MKKRIVMLGMLALTLPVIAVETNKVSQPVKDPSCNTPSKQGKEESGDRDELKERHLRLMKKALKEIGVTEEEREKIFLLQATHMEKMKANGKRINQARRKLSRLQDEGATIEQLDAAIDEVSDAQTEQLRILVRNRLEMERILGKEKSDLFMEKARQFYRSHGRRPGGGMPPRPNTPPVPNDIAPPVPPVPNEEGVAPPA